MFSHLGRQPLPYPLSNNPSSLEFQRKNVLNIVTSSLLCTIKRNSLPQRLLRQGKRSTNESVSIVTVNKGAAMEHLQPFSLFYLETLRTVFFKTNAQMVSYSMLLNLEVGLCPLCSHRSQKRKLGNLSRISERFVNNRMIVINTYTHAVFI